MKVAHWFLLAAAASIAIASLTGAAEPAPNPSPGSAPSTTAPATTAPATRPAFDLATYAGKPFGEEPAAIPGKLTCAFFDRGEDGIAYHDLDAVNHGSGELNRGPGEQDHFREKERVDISYTKAAFDKFADGKLLPTGQYYVGWTNVGEWLNYTVDVKEPGTYIINALLSSNNRDAALRLSVDGVDRTGAIAIPTTGHWHTWQSLEPFAELTLEKGRHVLTLEVIREGNMNLGTLEFVPKPKAGQDR